MTNQVKILSNIFSTSSIFPTLCFIDSFLHYGRQCVGWLLLLILLFNISHHCSEGCWAMATTGENFRAKYLKKFSFPRNFTHFLQLTFDEMNGWDLGETSRLENIDVVGLGLQQLSHSGLIHCSSCCGCCCGCCWPCFSQLPPATQLAAGLDFPLLLSDWARTERRGGGHQLCLQLSVW